MRELSDAEVFGNAPRELSDAEVFGAAPAAPVPQPEPDLTSAPIFDPMTGVDITGATSGREREAPSVLPGSVMGRLPADMRAPAQTTPVTPEMHMAISAAFNAGTPEQRQMMLSRPDYVGQVARDLDARYRGVDATMPPSESRDALDPRAEARDRNLVRNGAAPTAYTEQWARDEAAKGVDGTLVSAIQQAPQRPGIIDQAGTDLARGVGNLKATAVGLAAAGADAVGADQTASDLLDRYVQMNDVNAHNNPAVIGTYQNVHSLGDAGRYAVEAVMENLPMFAPTLLTGGAGALAGRAAAERVVGDLVESQVAAGVARDVAEQQAAKLVAQRIATGSAAAAAPTSIGMETGSIMGDTYAETGQKRSDLALLFGIPAGALDAIEPVMAIRHALDPVAHDLTGNLAMRFAREFGKNAATEAGTEALQQGIEQAAPSVADGRPFLTADLAQQMIDAGLKGAAGGGVSGGGAHAVTEAKAAFNTPERQIANEIRDAVRNTTINPEAVDAAARAALSPDRAQLTALPAKPLTDAEVGLTAQEPAPQPEAVKPAEPAPQPAAEPVTEPQTAVPENPRVRAVTTASGRKIDTELQVVDASTLQAAEGDLQNRDRSRASSDVQIRSIAAGLDPARLTDSAEADRGAPIVGPDNIVESGNGRVRAIDLAHAEFPEQSAAYRKHLESLGFDTTGIARPVLIRRRTTEMTPEERRQFIIEANQSSTMGLSSVERARSDADLLDDTTLSHYRGGDVSLAGNHAFVQAFVGRMNPAERAQMAAPDGGLSQDGQRRIEGALMARAYGDPELLTKFLEDRDSNVKSIGGAFLDQSGTWARLRAAIAAGRVKPQFDVTPQLVEAARTLSQLRDRGMKLSTYLQQQDAFSQRDPVTEQFLKAFYNPSMTRAAGREAVSDVLAKYADLAQEQTTDAALFGDIEEVTPEALLRDILDRRQEMPANEPTLFDKGATDGTDSVGSEPARANAEGAAHAADGMEEGQDLPRAEVRRIRKRKDRSSPPPVSQTVDDIHSVGVSKYLDEAFTLAGLDPETARLLPVDEQFDALASAAREQFGFREVVRDNNLNVREAIDALADALHNLQTMAAVLDMPLGGISLDGRLRLQLRRQAGGALAYYDPNDHTIASVRRNSSFAHEWGHALDWFIFEKFPPAEAVKGWGVSGQAKKGADGTGNPELAAAFKHLVDTMFKRQTDVAGAIRAIEKKIERVALERQKAQDKAAITTDSARKASLAQAVKQFDEQVRRLAAQIAKLAKVDPKATLTADTDYYLNGRMLAAGDAKDSDGEKYWTRPTEMLARAFEAYVANKIRLAGGDFDFATKTDERYQNTADQFLARAYPKDEDRDAIFAAFDNLMGAVQAQQALATGAAAAVAAGKNLPRRAFAPTATDRQHGIVNGILHSIRQASRERAQEAARREKRTAAEREQRARANPNHNFVRRTVQVVHNRAEDLGAGIVFSIRGMMLSYQARYPNTALDQLVDWFATDPGTGKASQQKFIEFTRQRSIQAQNDLMKIVDQYGLNELSDEKQRQLRDMMLGIGKQDPALVPAANALRKLYDDEYYYLQTHGINVGYAKHNYFPRISNPEAIAANSQDYLDRAQQTYRIVFSRDVGEWGNPDFKPAEFLKYASELIPDGHPQRDMLKEFRRINREIDRLERELGTSDDPDAVAHQLEKKEAELDDFMAEFYPVVQDEFALQAANDLYAREMGLVPNTTLQGERAPNSFLKGRVLPPEADKIMGDYMITNPVEVTSHYLSRTRRRVAFGQFFGEPVAKQSKPLGWKLDAAMTELKSTMLPDDFNELQKSIELLTGRYRPSITERGLRRHAYITAAVTPVLLGRALWAQFAEPVTIGTREGKVLAGALATYKAQIADLLTAAGIAPKSVAERAAWRAEMAQYIGATTHHLIDEIMRNRDNLLYLSRESQSRLSKFYYYTGIHPHAMSMRRAAVERAFTYLPSLAAKAERGEAAARRDLADLGIPVEKEYLDFIKAMGKRPDAATLETPIGRTIQAAIFRFVNEGVQEPSAIDKPRLASTPEFSFIYGITAFNYAFQRNVLTRYWKMVQASFANDKLTDKAKTGIGVAAGVAAIFASQAAFYILKNAFLSGGFDKDLDKLKQDPALFMTELMSRAGLFGAPADVLINAALGVRYDRDYTALFAGSYYGFILQNLQTMTKTLWRNSEHTNTAEHNAIRAGWDLFVAPVIAWMVLTRAPFLAPFLQLTGGPVGGNLAADAAVGEKDSAKKKPKGMYD